MQIYLLKYAKFTKIPQMNKKTFYQNINKKNLKGHRPLKPKLPKKWTYKFYVVGILLAYIIGVKK